MFEDLRYYTNVEGHEHLASFNLAGLREIHEHVAKYGKKDCTYEIRVLKDINETKVVRYNGTQRVHR